MNQEGNFAKSLKKFSELDEELYWTDSESRTFSDKKQLLNFFWYKSYSNIKDLDEVNEIDLVETLYKNYLRTKRFGQVGGAMVTMLSWDTLFKRLPPVGKILIGGLLIHYGGMLSLYYQVDNYFDPLSQVFKKYYLPQAQQKKLNKDKTY